MAGPVPEPREFQGEGLTRLHLWGTPSEGQEGDQQRCIPGQDCDFMGLAGASGGGALQQFGPASG